MSILPAGTVTFLFTDIEGSTRLWERHPDVMPSALAQHDAILREAIESNGGHVIKTTGDGFHAVFTTAFDALHAAIKAQRMLQASEVFGNSEVSSNDSIRVRMGIHTGEAELRDGDYYGGTLNRAARIMSAGHGGQVLLSSVAAELVRELLPESITLRDLGEHRLRDLTHPEIIFQLIAPDLPRDFPALKALNTLPNNLPAQITSFIGRNRERAEVNEKLGSARLLTLIGPGGTGKTRLSLQVANDQLADFKDGVWFVELAPLSDPNLILQTIATIFNVHAQAGMSLQEIVLNYLRAKDLLLILDNCEHLIEACAQIADQFLRTCPQMKIIASSREALGINGETVYRVPSLTLPDQVQVTREAALGYESIQLFVERASAANPRFQLTDGNASSVAQICSRLDGIPLALELAAARVAVFPVEQVAARLDDRFKLLTGGSRTSLPRQQTLRALIDWSYELLTKEECSLLRRLSVFAGGWTYEAMEAICPDLDVLSLIVQLVNKSLVIADEGETGRYRLLETIRQYARDKLLEAGEAALVRNRHLEYFVALAEALAPRLDKREPPGWLPRMDADYDNFLVAFDWGMNNDMEACLRLVGSLSYYWFRRGHGAEGIEMANTALARIDDLPAPKDEEEAHRQMLIEANALEAVTVLMFSQGDNKNAYRAGDRCIALARRLGDGRMLASALSFSASAKLFEGDFEDAIRRLEEGLAITRQVNEKIGEGMVLGTMAQVAMIVYHDPAAARNYEEEALKSSATFGDNEWLRLMLYLSTGRSAMFRGEFSIARECYAKCLPLFEEMKDEHRMNMIRSELAHMDRYEGKYSQAEEAYRKTILVWQKLGHRAAVAHQLESFAVIASAHGGFERAARLLGAAEILREKIDIDMSPSEREEYEKEVAALRAAMDASRFGSCWAEGRAMTMEQAIEFAISEDPQEAK